jgi:hypothetical protein
VHYRNILLATTVAATLAVSAGARADSIITMSATYFTIAENDQDMNRLPSGTFNNWVLNSLGSNGLPILNTAAFSPSSTAPRDLGPGNQIAWWSPTFDHNVTQTGTATVQTPINNGNFFPPNGTGSNNSNGFQAAIFQSILTIPTAETLTFSLAADDVAFVYLDGHNICSLGGVHQASSGSCTTATESQGQHTLEIFYADIENTQAVLDFGVTTSGITGIAPTPLPAALPLFAGGLGALGLLGWRRKRTARSVAA